MTQPPNADDQVWLDLLAGRRNDEAAHPTREEAAWLRAALLSYRAQAPQGQATAADQRVGRLLARARAAGVLPDEAARTVADGATAEAAPAPGPRRSRPGAWRWPRLPAPRAVPLWLGGAVAAATLLWALLPGTPTPEPAEHDVQRGGPAAAVVVRESADPITARDALLAELRQAGLDAAPYERLGRAGIDLDLPPALSPSQQAVLQRAGLGMAGGPQRQIEFRRPAEAPRP